MAPGLLGSGLHPALVVLLCSVVCQSTPLTVTSQDSSSTYSSTVLPTSAQAIATSSAFQPTTPEPNVFCETGQTGKETLKGVFTWDTTLAGTEARSPCPHGPPGASASRLCVLATENVGSRRWGTPDDSKCNFASNTTKRLDSLSKTEVNASNAVQVMDNLKAVIKNNAREGLTDVDLSKTADIVEKLVDVPGKLDELGQDIVDIVDAIMEVNETNLETSQRESNTSTKLLKAIDSLAENFPLSANETKRVLRSNSIVIQTNRIHVESFTGLSFDGDQQESGRLTTRIALPRTLFDEVSVGDADARVGFTLYRNNKLFRMIPEPGAKKEGAAVLNSMAISASVKGIKINNLKNPVSIQLQLRSPTEGGASTCVFWDFTAAGGQGNWSTSGCSLAAAREDSSRVTCQCSHLTSFAVLLSPNSGESRPSNQKLDGHAQVLSVISYAGSAVSLLGLLLTLVTYLLFKPLRKSHVQSFLMSLCVSIMLLLTVFITGAERRGSVTGCRCVAVLLHYFLLTSVAWMSLEAYSLYVSLVKVALSHSSSLFVVSSLVAWGVPALIVAITAGVASDNYGNDRTCVLTGVPFYAAQLAPVLACILYNIVVFTLVMVNLRRGSMATPGQRTSVLQRLRIAAALMGLLGLTWLFGALSVVGTQRVFEYLFCVFTTLQGFFIFYFHCFRQPDVRQHWKWFIRGRGLRGWRENVIQSKTATLETRTRKAEESMGNSSLTDTAGPANRATAARMFSARRYKTPVAPGTPIQLMKFSKIVED